ncbi:SRGAP1 family protein [Megaselia abdita]
MEFLVLFKRPISPDAEDIRLQLNEQLRCLDVRVESQVSLVQELQDFFRRRGELELDYCKSLDKLAKSLQIRHKEQKQKREQWPLFSSYTCWEQLIKQTKSLSKDHATMSEIYSTHIVLRLQNVIDDVQRIYKKCREIGYETHEEILRVLQELHTTMKTYHNYQTEAKAAEAKLRTAEAQRMKLQQQISKEKLERSKKYRLTEKEVQKRLSKYTDSKLKALKAKNEYQLCLEASNTTIHKYFVEDLSDLIDCMDLGFGSMVSRAILMHISADQGRSKAIMQHADSLNQLVNSIDCRTDKQKFLEQHHGAFMIPKRLEFQGQLNEESLEPELQKALHKEMEQRLFLLNQRVQSLRTESEEIWKTVESAEENLLQYMHAKDYECSGLFGDGGQAKLTDPTPKAKADKAEIEEFYITKIREFVLGTSRIARLDAKAELLRQALEKDSNYAQIPAAKSNVPKRKRIGRMNITGQPKLFGGSLEEYLEVTCEEIPLIMRSCIRVINVFGLHHQGIFRVSGSQAEISNFRECFERGEDPLADTTDASDINSVAGVLKLYFRELREPLFPIIYFDHFVSIAQLEHKHEMILGIRKFLQNLSRSVVIVMRYLFAFLNHLSEYSDENMMDAYNLAICFGPTLMPAPEDKDQVQYQNQVNELIKNMICHHEELFPSDLGGLQYEKYISEEPFIDIDVGDSPTDHATEDPDSEVYPSEDESDILEATAQFDFTARSNRELSFHKGDSVILKKQVSNDWWQGTVNGKDGLVPDKYISLKIKGEDHKSHIKSSSSEESIRKQHNLQRRPSGNLGTNQLSIFHQQRSGSNPQSIEQQNNIKSASIAAIVDSQKTKAQQQHQIVQQMLNEKIDTITAQQQQTLVVVDNVTSTNPVVTSDFHYDTVDNVKASSAIPILTNQQQTQKYGAYHDEAHSFENSMDFLEDVNHFNFEGNKQQHQKPPQQPPKQKPEPIYAEPSKPSKILSSKSGIKPVITFTAKDIKFEEYENVVLRAPDTNGTHSVVKNRNSENLTTSSPSVDVLARHSDGSLFKDSDRKIHSKSLSMSENHTNIFQQNKEMWEKRAEGTSQTRHAPDLVMDLPISESKEANVRKSTDSLEIELSAADELSTAERFASENQCTLKKNERFVTALHEKKPLLEEILHIDEDPGKDRDRLSPANGASSSSSSQKSLSSSSSPIPVRNTQKFISQFADLKLTGGCQALPIHHKVEQPPQTTSNMVEDSSSSSFLSFKPKPPILTKKPNVVVVRTPVTPELSRKCNKE